MSTRRAFLAAGSLATTLGLAGCSTLMDGDGDDDRETDGGAMSDGNETTATGQSNASATATGGTKTATADEPALSFVRGFEDVETGRLPPEWGPDWGSGTTGVFGADQLPVSIPEGSQALAVSWHSDSGEENLQVEGPIDPDHEEGLTPERIQFDLYLRERKANSMTFRLRSSGEDVFFEMLAKGPDAGQPGSPGGLFFNGEDTPTFDQIWPKGWVRFTLANIDWEARTYDIEMAGTGRASTGHSFSAEADDVFLVEITSRQESESDILLDKIAVYGAD